MINLDLIIAISYTVVGLALLIGGIIIPLVYTVIPLAKANRGCCPMNLVWRIVVKALFLLLIIEDAFIRYYVNHYQEMPHRASYTAFDIIVILGLAVALIATWLTHPDSVKSV